MSYTLTLTDGQILTTVPVQQADAVTTSLTLIGQDVNSYGSYINNNFVHLLENFANTTEPISPLVGQLWFDTVDQRMYVYNDSNQFKPVGGTIVSSMEPVEMSAGDLWIDTTAQQLKFTPDGSTIYVAGPMYDATRGKSGWVVDSVKDTTNNVHTITGLWSNGSLLGLLSEQAYTLQTPYGGMTTVGRGVTLNANTSTAVKLYGTATNADALNGVSGYNFLQNNANQILTGQLWINTNTSALSIGAGEDIQFYVNSGIATMFIGGTNEDFNLTLNSPHQVSALYINSTAERIGVFNTAPAYPLDIIGNTRIQGDLIVQGTSTYINVVNLQVNNSQIELAYGQNSPSDSFANNGGIVLIGASTKTFTWAEYNAAWTSSENINIPINRTYQVNGQPVLTNNSLGNVITSAPGLNSIGTLTNATIGQLYFTTSTIGTINSVPLILGTGLTTNLDFNNQKAFNAATPTIYDPNSTVANKGYVDAAVSISRAGQFGLSLDISNTTTVYTSATDPRIDAYVISQLELLYPPTDPSPYGIPDGGRARVQITQYQTGVQSNVPSNYLDPGIPVTIGSNTLIQYSSTLRVTTNIPAALLLVNKAIKQYIVSGGVWTSYPTQPANLIYTDGSW